MQLFGPTKENRRRIAWHDDVVERTESCSGRKGTKIIGCYFLFVFYSIQRHWNAATRYLGTTSSCVYFCNWIICVNCVTDWVWRTEGWTVDELGDVGNCPDDDDDVLLLSVGRALFNVIVLLNRRGMKQDLRFPREDCFSRKGEEIKAI